MTVSYYCRRCQEILADGQAVCPFCDSHATPIDDVLHENFAVRNAAFNKRVQSILDEEEKMA